MKKGLLLKIPVVRTHFVELARDVLSMAYTSALGVLRGQDPSIGQAVLGYGISSRSGLSLDNGVHKPDSIIQVEKWWHSYVF